MQTQIPTAAEAREVFTLYMERHRMRKTPERFAILQRVCGMKNHFSADELYEAMEDSSYHVSRATVYNSLKVLCDAGIVRPQLLGKKCRYELSQEGGVKLVCLSCGKVKQVESSDLQNRVLARKYPAFVPAYATTFIYGRCASCVRRSKRSKAEAGLKSSGSRKQMQTNK